jgi:hypothetical protein
VLEGSEGAEAATRAAAATGATVAVLQLADDPRALAQLVRIVPPARTLSPSASPTLMPMLNGRADDVLVRAWPR